MAGAVYVWPRLVLCMYGWRCVCMAAAGAVYVCARGTCEVLQELSCAAGAAYQGPDAHRCHFQSQRSRWGGAQALPHLGETNAASLRSPTQTAQLILRQFSTDCALIVQLL